MHAYTVFGASVTGSGYIQSQTHKPPALAAER